MGWINSIYFERWWPIVAALMVVAFWCVVGSPFPKTPEALLSVGATIAAVVSGFLGTVIGILFSVRKTKTVMKIFEAGYQNDLAAYIKCCLIFSLSFLVVSVAGFVVSPHFDVASNARFPFITWGTIFGSVWFFFCASMIFTYLRITNVMFRIFLAD